jgi:hypothetical protein
VRPYVVCQGDSLTTLAASYGFDAQSTWAASENASLRALRSDPDALAACDVLYIPDAAPPVLHDLTQGTTNQFTSTPDLLYAAIKCQDETGQPLAGKAYVIEGLPSSPIQGTTDESGLINLELPADATSASVYFSDLGYALTLNVAHLDPSEEDSGVQQRLEALGLLGGSPAVVDSDAFQIVADEYRQAAIAAFQTKNGLAVTGVVDDATRTALATSHGA